MPPTSMPRRDGTVVVVDDELFVEGEVDVGKLLVDVERPTVVVGTSRVVEVTEAVEGGFEPSSRPLSTSNHAPPINTRSAKTIPILGIQ